MHDWPMMTKELSAQLRNLRGGASEVMKAFAGMAQAATAARALDAKTKELIALGIAVAGGEEIDDRACMEIYLNDPTEVPEAELRTEICIPLK